MWKFLNHSNNIDNLTMENLDMGMKKIGLSASFAADIISSLQSRLNSQGEEAFQEWLANLHFKLPEEFQDEQIAKQLYIKHQSIIESEVKKLEKETKLGWEIQTEDIEHLHNQARKTQLVIRHRLTEVVMDLTD